MNPHKVKKGQIWQTTDKRSNRGGMSVYNDRIRVEKVSPSKGVAHVVTVDYEGKAWPWLARPRTIRLDRFCPKHHYRKVA